MTASSNSIVERRLDARHNQACSRCQPLDSIALELRLPFQSPEADRVRPSPALQCGKASPWPEPLAHSQNRIRRPELRPRTTDPPDVRRLFRKTPDP